MQFARQAQIGKVGCLTVGFLGIIEKNFLPSLISSFRAKYPYIKLSLKLLTLGALDKALEAMSVDVGFTLIEKPTPRYLSWEKIFNDTLCVVSHRDNPLIDRLNINLFHMANEAVLFQDQATTPRGFANLIRVCSNRGFIPNVNLAPNWGTLLLSIESGMGISILPRCIPESYGSPHLHLVDFEGDDIYVDFAVAWNTANPNPAISLFVNELEAILSLQANNC
jgi:DNA-binding transcriptional LysR family regulator